MARRKQSLDAGRLSHLTRERGSGRLCGLRNGEQHVDKLAQRTAGTASLRRGAVGLGVVCRRRSERRMLGWAYGPNLRIASARPTATSQPEKRVAITRKHRSQRAFGPLGLV
jgi:hypothetical protein